MPLALPQGPLVVFVDSAAPTTAADAATLRARRGYLWVSDGPEIWVCVDPAEGAAVWYRLGNAEDLGTAAEHSAEDFAPAASVALLTAGMAEALGQIGVIGRSVETLRKRALAQGEVTIDNADAGGWLIPAGNTVAVTLPYELIDTDYAVAAEIILAEPGVAHAGQVVVTERAVNGFTLRVTGAARNIVVRWTVLNPRQLYQ